mgnify:CR=1 FL=1
MELLFGGIVMGFILSCVIFQSRVWRLQDKVEYYQKRADFFKEKCLEEHRKVEWQKCEDSSLFEKL